MRSNVLPILAASLLILSNFSCIDSAGFPDEPTLEFVSFSQPSMLQGKTLNDSVFMTLAFTDGDGDLGSETDINLQLIDNRTGNTYGQFRVPPVPEAGANNGISGTMRIKVFTTCCLQPDGEETCEEVTVPDNELSFEVVLTDRSGNESNRLMTPPVVLRCF